MVLDVPSHLNLMLMEKDARAFLLVYLSQAWEITDVAPSHSSPQALQLEFHLQNHCGTQTRNTLRFQSAAKFYFWREPAKASTAPEVAIEWNNKTLFRRTSKTDSLNNFSSEYLDE